MITHPQQALDAMFKLFNDKWKAGATAIVGYVPQIVWPLTDVRAIPAADKYWCRVSTQSVGEPLASLSEVVEPGKRMYEPFGLLFIQLFVPKSDAQAAVRGLALATLARNSFKGVQTPNGVWFRESKINNLPDEEKSYRFNIIVEYEYNEII